MRRATPRRHAGFTLLEILVVLTIIGVVMTIGTSTFVAVTAAWHERRALTELDNQAQAVFESIGEDIAATISYDVSGAGVISASRTVKDDRTYPAAMHADDEISLPVNIFDTARNQTAPGRVGYRVDRAAGTTGVLTRTTGPLAGDFPAGGRLDLVPAKVQGFSVEYLGDDAKAVWSEVWAGPGLPRAVRVSIALEDPVRPEFQVARKAVFPIRVR